MTLPFTNENCSTNHVFGEWTTAASVSAESNGINTNLYQSVIYVFPQSMPGCDSLGYGELGNIGSQTDSNKVWIFGAPYIFLDEWLVAHEIGHNLGLLHSKSYQLCASDQPFENHCQFFNEYGDYDVMGGKKHLPSNLNLARLGWLNGRTENFDSPGVYHVSLMPTAPPAKRTTMARIRLKDANGNSIRKSLFLEFRRQALPFDIFSLGILADRGVSIRYADDDLLNPNTQGSYLIDTTFTRYPGDEMLLPGNTFSNSYYGVSITTVSVSPLFGARVKIELTR